MPSGELSANPESKPVRNPAKQVVALSIALAMMTSMDRPALSLARSRIVRDLGLSDVQMGLVFGAFTIAYAASEIPSGFLGDRSGPRGVMLRIALWWALFMALISRTAGFTAILAAQLVFGAGAAGVYPSIARSFATFLEPRRRVRAQGLIWLGARWGGALTPILMALLFRWFTWRGAYLAISVFGVAWATAAWFWFPRSAKVLSAMPRSRVPWREIGGSRTVVLLCVQYFALVFSWNFLVSWAPTFLDERFHPDAARGAVLKALPLLAGGLGALTSGMLGERVPRKLLAAGGFAGAAVFLALAAWQRSALTAAGAIALSSFSNDLIMPACWAEAAEAGGRWAGTVSAIMNMVGNVGGALYGFTAGLLLSATGHNWDLVLWAGAAMYVVGAVTWLFIDSSKVPTRDGGETAPALRR